MRTLTHRFLLMLLMLALPLQTLASASMMACAMPQQAEIEHIEHTAMASEAMAGCHESEPSPATSHNCKHCATCVLASALPIPAFDNAAVLPPAQSYALQPAVAFSGFVPSGPERPPRATFA